MRSHESKSAAVVERESGLRRLFGRGVQGFRFLFSALDVLEFLVLIVLVVGATLAFTWKGLGWFLGLVGLG